jgi:olfactory receptor
MLHFHGFPRKNGHWKSEAGITQKLELRLPLFLLFLGVYVVTVVGNLCMILLITISPLLHTPMYYFLSSSSFIDFCYSTVIIPKVLVNFLGKKNMIPYTECMAQLFFFVVFVVAEGYLLTAMAYDRCAAICIPLLCNVIMSSGSAYYQWWSSSSWVFRLLWPIQVP